MSLSTAAAMPQDGETIVPPPLQLSRLDALEGQTRASENSDADETSEAQESIQLHAKSPVHEQSDADENSDADESRLNPLIIPRELQTCMAQTLLEKVRKLPGNNRCCDCGAWRPEWASTTLSSLVCLKCAGTHRSLGIRKSRIRSLNMDSWSSPQVCRMLAGGNARLRSALHADDMEWNATGTPLSAAAARARYDSAAATQYTRALDAKCAPDPESDEDEAPGFGSFIMQKMVKAKKASVQMLSPCVIRNRLDSNKATMFCCIGRSFSQLCRSFSWADKPATQTAV